MDSSLIHYKDVKICQEDRVILENINLDLNKGEFVYLIGKVGSGKSSLLKTIYAELDVAAGEANVLGYDLLKIKERQIPKLRKQIGIVFQDFQLLTDRTVHDNLKFVLRSTGWKEKNAIEERIEEVLSLVGMEDKMKKMPHELSGGEQQRVVISRAVLNSPDIILADEPTGNLDLDLGCAITELLQDISKKGSLVVMSTHNLQLLNEYPSDKVYRCADGQMTVATEFFSL